MIRDGQAPSGAYIACPRFEPYRYCWFRDGSFVADAMSRVGEVESAEAFFEWCARVLLARRERIQAGEHPHARYTAEGEESAMEWPTFQLDGFGTLLWALKQHESRHGRGVARFEEAARLLLSFLALRWDEPCVDWWEEREGVHPATLGCLYGGFAAWGDEAADDVRHALEAIVEPRLDGSLLAVATPFGGAHVDLADLAPLVSPSGGVHRHLEDTYYGGGEWLLLTAWLGWALAERGRRDEAREKLEWVAAHATAEGHLRSSRRITCSRPRCSTPGLRGGGRPPPRSCGRTRCS